MGVSLLYYIMSTILSTYNNTYLTYNNNTPHSLSFFPLLTYMKTLPCASLACGGNKGLLAFLSYMMHGVRGRR